MEQIYLKDNEVIISTTQIVLDSKTFQVAETFSVTVLRKWLEPKKVRIILLSAFSILLGVLLSIVALPNLALSSPSWYVSVFVANSLIIIGSISLLVLLRLHKLQWIIYAIRLNGTYGQTEAFSSLDRAYIQKVADAIHLAMSNFQRHSGDYF